MNTNKQQPQAKLNTVNYQDLIISNPENQVFWKRVTSFLVTLFFWGLWFYLWTPFPGLVYKLSQSGFTQFFMYPEPYVIAFFSLLLVMITWHLGWLNYNVMRFKRRGRRVGQTALSNQDLGQFFTVDNSKLDNWQHSKCLVIQHNETGEIQEIDINDFISFIPPLLDTKAEDQALQRYYIVLLPDTANEEIFIEYSNVFIAIIKVICSVFKIKFIKCQVARNHLFLVVDMPGSYDAEDMVNQLKATSDLIFKRQYGSKLPSRGAKDMFWRVDQLVTTAPLTDNEIQHFFEEINSNNKPFYAEGSSIKNAVPKKDEIASRRLASDFWKNNQRLIIENEETKRTSQIDISDFFICAPLSLEDAFEGKQQRFFVVILPTKQQRDLFTEIAKNFKVIMKVLCSMFNIGLVDCIVTKTHLTLVLDIPESFSADEIVEQLKKASAAIIEKKYGAVTTQTKEFVFWNDEQLITVPELVDVEVKAFTASIKP